MIHTDEDDEFDRILREQEIRKGQPYHWKVEATIAAVKIEREECARIAEKQLNWGTALAIRARSDTSSKRVDTNGEHKHDN
jgi:radical SAM superfamily enzyme YgiQ (UPF0313 family)